MTPVSARIARLPDGHGLERGAALSLTVDGRTVIAYEGETVAAVLLAEGHIATRNTRSGSPRGVYCGMGVCFDCLVVVDGVPNTRACVTWVREGMDIARQDGLVPAAGAQ
jgi:predicted molibdopterin-dependent oxidoreductase YjgC